MSDKANIILTDGLVKRIRQLQEKEGNPALMLRLAVNGGGCSGFQYEFGFAESAEDDDAVFEKDGISVVIDEMSLNFLDGATVDFKTDLQGSFFQVDNPNAQASCGCGTSFSV